MTTTSSISERLATPLAALSRIGPKRQELLSKIGLETVGDCLEYYPRDYLDRRKFVTLDRAGYTDETETVEAQVVNHVDVPVRKENAPKVSKIILYDGNGLAALVGFGKRAGLLKHTLPKGTRIVVSGRFKRSPQRDVKIETTDFEYEILDDEEAELIHTGRLVPVYGLTKDLTQRVLRELIAGLADTYADDVPEALPESLRRKYRLIEVADAVRQIHLPDSEEWLTQAKRRLVFEEFFTLQLALLLRKKKWEREEAGIAFTVEGERIRDLLASLPFDLTAAQKRVVAEIEEDMRSPRPMNRLAQGDVGSGKTVVAAIALARAADNCYQGALMAPTEILAEQHLYTLQRFLSAAGIRTVLLKGDMPAAIKRGVLEEIADGRAQVAVGTHALIQEGVRFGNLGLVITDEQHRFGVMQRAQLRNKGRLPDTLIMTATPIPRTLALTAYGDLSVSVIDELPPGRTPITTKHFPDSERDHVYRFLESQLAKGRQAYIIYPLVDESEKLEEVKAATEEWERIAEAFPKRRVGLLHGRMDSEEKQEVMRWFKAHELDIIVATTVVEVGVDVPNANVIVIEHVERFGLAQLHQLRGRVGRGEHPSFCALMGYAKSEEGKRRIDVMVRTTDGFEIAEEDLAIRGPGELLGTRQAGMPDLKLGNLIRDTRILEVARAEAQALVDADPELRSAETATLRAVLVQRWGKKLRLAQIG